MIFLGLFFLALTSCGYAQFGIYRSNYKNSFFAEGATRSALVTINYDRIFRFGEELSYSYRIGFSYINTRFFGLLGMSAFTTGEGPHHYEISAVIEPSALISYKQLKPMDIKSDFRGTLGYRYQNFEKPGLFIKAGLGVMFIYDPPIKSLVGVFSPRYIGVLALGYSF